MYDNLNMCTVTLPSAPGSVKLKLSYISIVTRIPSDHDILWEP
jgi:hypothetical protein